MYSLYENVDSLLYPMFIIIDFVSMSFFPSSHIFLFLLLSLLFL